MPRVTRLGFGVPVVVDAQAAAAVVLAMLNAALWPRGSG